VLLASKFGKSAKMTLKNAKVQADFESVEKVE
jgi:hypothetical protein